VSCEKSFSFLLKQSILKQIHFFFILESEINSGDDHGFNISINRYRHGHDHHHHHHHQQQQQHRSNSQEYSELIKFINIDSPTTRRSESMNRERRASVTKVVMVKDKRSSSNCSSEHLNMDSSSSSKRYSITKILPVRSKFNDEITVSASNFNIRSRSSEERHMRTEVHANLRDQSLDSGRKYSVTKVFPVRSNSQLRIDLDQGGIVNIDHSEFRSRVEQHQQQQQHHQSRREVKREVSEHTCYHGGVTSNMKDFELKSERGMSVDSGVPSFMNAKFLQLKKYEEASNEARYIQMKRNETESQEEYLQRMETIIARDQTEVEEMNEASVFIEHSQTNVTQNDYSTRENIMQTDYSQNDYSEIQKEIDEVKQAIETVEESISKQEESEGLSAEEAYLQRRDERRMKKHVSFDLIPDVVHEYGESAETTEVEEMTDEDGELARATQQDLKEEYFEIGKLFFLTCFVSFKLSTGFYLQQNLPSFFKS